MAKALYSGKKWKFLIADTIMSGDWSKAGKYHTIENISRLIGIYIIFLSGSLGNFWLILFAIPFIGLNIVPVVRDDHKRWEMRVW